MKLQTNMTDLELCKMIAYYIENGDYIVTRTQLTLCDRDGSWLPMLIQPKEIGIITDTVPGYHLVVPDTLTYCGDSMLFTSFKFLAIQFVARITEVVVIEKERISSKAPGWNIKEEFLFKKVLIAKNKKTYANTIPLQEGQVILNHKRYKLACLTMAKLNRDPNYYWFTTLSRAARNMKRRRNEEHENLSILQKLRNVGSILIRIYRRWRDRKRV